MTASLLVHQLDHLQSLTKPRFGLYRDLSCKYRTDGGEMQTVRTYLRDLVLLLALPLLFKPLRTQASSSLVSGCLALVRPAKFSTCASYAAVSSSSQRTALIVSGPRVANKNRQIYVSFRVRTACAEF